MNNNLRKLFECLHTPTILAFLSQPNGTYSSLIRQLEAVIFEVSTVQAQRLRTNRPRMHKARSSSPTKATCGHTGFHYGQANSFNMKVLVFAEAGHILFFSYTAATNTRQTAP